VSRFRVQGVPSGETLQKFKSIDNRRFAGTILTINAQNVVLEFNGTMDHVFEVV
jgi:hypothetical protein